MKKLSYLMLIVFTILVSLSASAAKSSKMMSDVTGSVVSEAGTPIAYATVVLLTADSSQVAGAVSGEDGKYKLSAQSGSYTLKVNCMGYEDSERNIKIAGSEDVGSIVLRESSTKIEEVVVKAKVISREADRFVVNVSGSNLAIGKNTYEMIGVSPGVRADDNGIKINGRSGTNVMIGERMLTMSGDELIAYLKSIPAENVQKIEVIPVAGAEYDADSAGGIIKITLKKQRNDGIDGTLSLSSGSNLDKNFAYGPSLRINYQKNKWNIYTSGSYDKDESYQGIKEQLNYFDANGVSTANVVSDDNMNTDNLFARISLGAVYDLNDRNSFGGEFNYSKYKDETNTLGTSTMNNLNPMFSTVNSSDYHEKSNGESMNSTLNYILKIDTLGSTFKLIGDYSQSLPDAHNLYLNSAVNSLAPAVTDKTYKQSLMDADYKIYAVTANVDKNFKNQSSIKFGGKFSYNTVFSDTKYYKSISDSPYDWVYDAASTNPATNYKERIGALYLIYNKSFGRLNLSAGVRGEYTELSNTSGDVHQNYFDLFPNATLSYNLNKEGSNMLIGQYSRTIARPSFSRLNADRTQFSEYTYVIGNPDLRPQYTDIVDLTYVLNYKYTFTLVGQIVNNVIMQQLFTTPGSDIVYYQFTNMAKQRAFGLVASLPFDITKWWSMSTDWQWLYMRTENAGETNAKWFGNASLQSSITLPHNFIFEMSGWYMTAVKFGNLEQKASGTANVALKKRLKDNKVTVSLGVTDIFNRTQHVKSWGAGFTDNFSNYFYGPHVTMSLSYNFNAGKKFSRRTVESGASDENSRMEK